MQKILITLVAICLATSNAYAVSCKSFSSQAEAQAYFKKYNAKKLDRDDDGIACEHLKGKKAKKKSKKKR